MMPAMNKLGMIVIMMAGLAGCGGGKQSGGKAKDECMAVATNVGAIFSREVAGEAEGMAEALPDIQQVFADHCVADKWSPSAISCLRTAQDHAGLEACEPTISKAQQDALKADLEAKMGNMGSKGDASSAPPTMQEGGTGGGGGGGMPEGDGADPCGGGE